MLLIGDPTHHGVLASWFNRVFGHGVVRLCSWGECFVSCYPVHCYPRFWRVLSCEGRLLTWKVLLRKAWDVWRFDLFTTCSQIRQHVEASVSYGVAEKDAFDLPTVRMTVGPQAAPLSAAAATSSCRVGVDNCSIASVELDVATDGRKTRRGRKKTSMHADPVEKLLS